MTWPNRVAAAVSVLTVSVALAQSPPSAEQYQDALNQLKAAQDRKNELATENQKLRQQMADEQKQSAEKMAMLQGRAYYLREHYAAWQQFIDQNPMVRTMWSAYFEHADTADRVTELLGDGRWPFAVEGS